MEESFRRLREEGFRLTPQRASIMRFMEGNLNHPTAEEIFNYVRKEFPSISFSTVYNNLRTLEAAGLVKELLYDPSRFDSNLEEHCHIVCVSCNRIEDFNWPRIKGFKSEVNKQTRFSVKNYDIGIFGICPRCRGKGKSEQRA